MRIICFWNRRGNKTDKPQSVTFEVYISRTERLTFRTGVIIEQRFWDFKTDLVKPNHPESKLHNLKISEIKEKLHKAADKLIKSGWPITADNYKKALENDHSGQTFNDYLSQQLELDSGTLKHSTYRRLKSVVAHWNKFGTYKFYQIDSNTIRAYHNYCLKTMKPSTTGKNHKVISKYLKRAIAQGLMEVNPYSSFKIPAYAIRRTFLTTEELNQIREKNIVNTRLNVVRDMFLFMCLTGLEYADLQLLKHSDIVTKEENLFIIKERTKTAEVYAIPLLPEAIEIISKYPPTPDNKDFIFPRRSNQRLNSYLVEIAALCNVEKTLTTIVARHTFATLILTKGMPIETVSHILGHSNVKTTKIYAKLITAKITADLKRLNITNL